MEIRGTGRNLMSHVTAWVKPTPKPVTFSQKFDQAKSFFRDRNSVLWRMPLYSLSFFTIGSNILPTLFGAYAGYKLWTMEKGDPANWRTPLYGTMAANGVVPLSPLAFGHPIEPLRHAAQAIGIDGGLLQVIEPLTIFVGLPIMIGIGRFAYSLCNSGKTIRNLAAAASLEETGTVAKTFLTAQKRLDRKIVFKTMRQIKSQDKAVFLEIYDAMTEAADSGRRTQKLLAKLKTLAEATHV